MTSRRCSGGRAAPTDDAADAGDDDDAPGESRGARRRGETRATRAGGKGRGGATPERGQAEARQTRRGDAEATTDDIDSDDIDAVADRLAADADEDEAWDELDHISGGTIAYGRIPWPNDELDDISEGSPRRLPASVERARLDRLAARFDPNEFLARYGDRINEADAARVLEKVREVSRAVEERRAALRRDS